ncbi:MAG: hypothetical protein JXX28_14615 [Deltaproteobacteria bacterium]|nr:hypothetical protein [Deltaproteobacteria bacterium]
MLLLVGSGCTATKAAYHIVDAADAVSRAEERRAPELAVYEYTLATRYLDKAREEAGYSDYLASVRLSQLSEEWADRSIIAIDQEGRDVQLEGVDAAPQRTAPPAQLPAADGATGSGGQASSTPPAELPPAELPPGASPASAGPTAPPSTVPLPEPAPNPWGD